MLIKLIKVFDQNNIFNELEKFIEIHRTKSTSFLLYLKNDLLFNTETKPPTNFILVLSGWYTVCLLTDKI